MKFSSYYTISGVLSRVFCPISAKGKRPRYHPGPLPQGDQRLPYAALPSVQGFFPFTVLTASIKKDEMVTVISEKAMRVTGM